MSTLIRIMRRSQEYTEARSRATDESRQNELLTDMTWMTATFSND